MLSPPRQAASLTLTPAVRLVTAHSLREAADLRRPRVLLAEDNAINQKTAVRMLEMLGYQVDLAVTGIQAVDACRRVEYGIVLMDNQMPERDGLTAAGEIRRADHCVDGQRDDRRPRNVPGRGDDGEILERWSPAAEPPTGRPR